MTAKRISNHMIAAEYVKRTTGNFETIYNELRRKIDTAADYRPLSADRQWIVAEIVKEMREADDER